MGRSKQLVAFVLISALLASCSAGGDDPEPTVEHNGPRGAVPAGLERFYGQELRWDGCAPFVSAESDRQYLVRRGRQCTRLQVPLDYAKPAGETITIGLLRVRAASSDDRIGALVVNPGGPGVSGLSTAARLADSSVDLRKRFDFVGFDPRGVGSSEPTVRCLTDAERDAERADDDELDVSPSGVAKVEADQRSYAARCAERTGKGAEMLANLGTRDVVKDIDVLRSALGEDKLNYLGYSYGTRIGSTYAETFPGNVRAMVLDGALDPDQDAVSELVAQAEGFQKAFEDFVGWCVQRQDCALGGDQTGALAQFHDLIRPLGTRPVDVGDGRKLSYSDATTAVVQALYTESLWENLNGGLNDLKRNRAAGLMTLADSYLERAEDGRYSTTQDAFTAIRCVDDPRVTDKSVVLEAQRRYKQVAPFLDDGNPPTESLDACAFWPVPNTSDPHLPSVPGLPPVLVISTTGDPATPYRAGVELAKALKGRLLTYEATQHTVFLHGVSCVDGAGVAYLVGLTLPADGTRCSA